MTMSIVKLRTLLRPYSKLLALAFGAMFERSHIDRATSAPSASRFSSASTGMRGARSQVSWSPSSAER